MIEEYTTRYLGSVGNYTNYKLAKYANETSSELTSKTTVAKVGLLRAGELLSSTAAGESDAYYWTLTPYGNGSAVQIIHPSASQLYGWQIIFGGLSAYKKPCLNLKQNVVITSGNGTKNNPFTLSIN